MCSSAIERCFSLLFIGLIDRRVASVASSSTGVRRTSVAKYAHNSFCSNCLGFVLFLLVCVVVFWGFLFVFCFLFVIFLKFILKNVFVVGWLVVLFFLGFFLFFFFLFFWVFLLFMWGFFGGVCVCYCFLGWLVVVFLGKIGCFCFDVFIVCLFFVCLLFLF